MQSQAPDKTSSVLSPVHPGKGSGRSLGLLAMLAACSAVFLTALDQTVVVTALPSIITDLQIPLQQLDRAAWIISAYLLGYVIAMPLMGRISDLYGRRLVFVICLSLFGLASLCCGLAPLLGQQIDLTFLQAVGINISTPGTLGDASMLQPGLVWLVAARFVQAAGGGALIPVAMAVAGDYYGERQRSLALGLIGMVTEAGGVLGPLYGAIIVQNFSWQLIFYLNLPLVLLLIGMIVFLLKPQKQAQPGSKDTTDMSSASLSAGSSTPFKGRVRIDLLGTLLLGASLFCMSLGLSQEAIAGTTTLTSSSQTAPGNNPILLGCALLLFLIFVAFEIFLEYRASLRGSESQRLTLPIIEPSLFRRSTFTASAFVSLLIGAALIIAMAEIPLFIATVQNGTTLDSGLALLRLTIMIPIGALIGGWLCPRLTCRWTAILGLIPAVLGFWLMHLWPVQVDWGQITASTLICGLGFGLVIAPISTSAINAVRRSQMGMAASVVTLLRMVGMILGLAALTSWGLGRFYEIVHQAKMPVGMTVLSPEFAAYEAQLATNAAHDVYTSIFLAAGVLCLIAILPAFLLEGRRSSLADTSVNAEQ